MGVLRDYYNTGYDSQAQFGVSGPLNPRRAQLFEASSSYDIGSVKLRLYRSGNPGTITVQLQGVSGGNPDANVLASGTTNGNNLTTNTAGEWIEITFSVPYSVVSGTDYAIVLSAQAYNAYWKIDNGGTYPDGVVRAVTVGESWGAYIPTSDGMFETYDNLAAPGKPTNPSPSDTGSDITLDESPLSWDASNPAADTYEVYFGESGSEVLIGTAQAGVEFEIDFGTLGYGITYGWRIDATNEAGTTTGDTWTFDTIAFDEPEFSYVLIAGGPGPYDDPPGVEGTDWAKTGDNNMITIRRLVAAANSKIWYEDL